ncbi:VanZ family protein [Aquibacillus koreensis]|uniref:VanZ family protein n=2 Tax=Aquibacillus koreensis TaxID=279446 RepID=A0A9X3WM44_9BACI|nr:VanZ family protein [Aquibacillus koreensis]MCT2536329.1 VanZ family protein [Aquibacillus koreensis]MDC3421320.1 VanZ family protein [Aquibacillus koreensis]
MWSKLRKSLLVVCFLIYLTFLLYLLFFSHYRQAVKGNVGYNIIPFESILSYLSNFDKFSIYVLTDNFFGNILAFIPFGFLLPTIWTKVRAFIKILALSCCCSLSIELAQFLFQVGAFDVDDIILNTVGGGVGFSLYLLIKKGF